jgi:hypothetical protein
VTAGDYTTFLASKARAYSGDGITPSRELPAKLYAWQTAIVQWALRKGRAAIFADCGLGKTFMQIAWADQVPGRVLFLAPLCVAEQTVQEADKLGIRLRYARTPVEAGQARLVITNYERLKDFDATEFAGVVLDESSILKAFDGQTRTTLIRTFATTKYRLCCTATPSPNDITELANHAEFLGIMSRPDFLASWFVRVGEGHRTTTHHGWRMKRHAVAAFYRWMASWAIALRSPSDLGYDDAGFVLPRLDVRDLTLSVDRPMEGALFPELGLHGLKGRLAARRTALVDRVQAVQDLTSRGGQWLLWCGLNPEADALAKSIDGAVNVQGSDSYAEKVGAVEGFVRGDIRVLVTKPKILGFGMNFQHCHQMAFVGINDSYESYYQCIRRCWRYGQKKPVQAWIVVSEAERLVVENVRQKEQKADAMCAQLLAHLREIEREELVA